MPIGMREQKPRQALVLKSVRLSSALRAGWVLLKNGLVLDAGATMRAIDELTSDIMFIAWPLVFQHPPEPRHAQYLAEFFQEEFDHPDPLQATQKRKRLSRCDIRAYVARTFEAGLPVSQIVTLSETIDAAFSGYVHGAAAHTMDIYDARKFVLPLRATDQPLSDMMDQYVMYIYRAMMSVAIAAKALAIADHLKWSIGQLNLPSRMIVGSSYHSCASTSAFRPRPTARIRAAFTGTTDCPCSATAAIAPHRSRLGRQFAHPAGGHGQVRGRRSRAYRSLRSGSRRP